MLKELKYIVFIFLLVFSLTGTFAHAQEAALDSSNTVEIQPEQIPAEMQEPEQETMKGIVLEILDQGSHEVYGREQKYAIYNVRFTDGSKKGEEVEITAGLYEDTEPFAAGNKVFVLYSKDFTGQEIFYITDYNRINPLILLVTIFVILVVMVSKKWGVTSLFGLFYSFIIIFKFILPQLAQGTNPLTIAIAGALMIAPVTFYLSHGFNKKTTIALISTVIALVITGILATVSVEITKLTGFGSEEAMFLQYAKGGLINIKNLLLAGIIIGTLGVLDDVTVNQAAIVFKLKKANRNLDPTEIFHMAMDIGHDHIASMVNTLVLVYTGAALPLLLLFIDNPVSTLEVVNSEIIAEEIVRTLVGSIGLILAVPITTLLAAKYYKETSNVKRNKN